MLTSSKLLLYKLQRTSTRGVSGGSLQATARAGASTQNQLPRCGLLAGTKLLGCSLTLLMPATCIYSHNSGEMSV